MLYSPMLQAALAGVAQLVEHLLAKEKVAGPNPVSRSSDSPVIIQITGEFFPSGQ